MNKKYCLRCGTTKGLKKTKGAYFYLSENSNLNVMLFEEAYICESCEVFKK